MTSKAPRIIMGIDPGAHTGIALYTDGKLTQLSTVPPSDIQATITHIRPARVVFEDSRLISHTFTTVRSRPAALKMARNVGEIDAWCRLITQVCESLRIPALGISPKGKGAKADAAAFERITGWTGQSNQHTRDAGMVAWPHRNAKGRSNA